jgi:hypothetical protein
MALEISGTVTTVLKQESGTGKNNKEWFKQTFVIETKDQYPKKVAFLAWGDKCDLIPKEGTEVKVFFNPESREYNGKYFTDLSMWKVEYLSDAPVKKPMEKTGLDLESDENQDLPF